ncbi:SRPBCC family protein [Microterricola pindariensis]|uniref:SRPBCC domain-containing protein n=1 Tax=Microterricola pindariensis TaxID=478010 RepID=A0ABX5AYF5_9MICO|nr:hypothetical protein [Microterricola pindariensis]PPL19923.1 hypothetical protein GY24_03140 [Microterricola pindariensis]
MTAVIEVDATVEEAYAHWRRTNGAAPQRTETGAPTGRVHWAVRVNGVPPDSEPALVEPNGTGRSITWASPEERAPDGEVTFDPIDGGGTRVMIALEWQRPDSQESYIPLMFLDGVQINADLRGFKRELESGTRSPLGWEQTLQRFEAL